MYHEYLNPSLNYHRPCFFLEIRTDQKGKQGKIYRYEMMMTPYDKLKPLPQAATRLNPGLTYEILDATAYPFSDNQAADRLPVKLV